MAEHLHRPVRYQSMGKPASVYITCRCGEYRAAGTWWFDAPGWDAIHWKNHGHRKLIACERRWAKHVRKIRTLRARHESRQTGGFAPPSNV